MELGEKAEEVLETLWIITQEDKKPAASLSDLEPAEKDTFERLIEAGLISPADNGMRLTEIGKPLARDVVRRHRLAERLLLDVLGTGDKLMHERACKFEHLLDHGLDESICSLLGHPKVCPHGKPIPPGRCCLEQKETRQRVVAALSQMTPGQAGKVAYIHTGEPEHLQKLTAMGILPGAPITLLQDFPSYVFQIRQTQFAVDKEIAGAIFIRLIEAETPEPSAEYKPRGWLSAKR